MNRRTMLALFGLAALSVATVTANAPFHAAFAKDGSGGGGGDKGGEGGDKPGGGEAKPEEGQQDGGQDGSETEQPGMEAQPEAATECAAGADCKKE